MAEPNFHSSPSHPMEAYSVVVLSMKVSQVGCLGQERDSHSHTSQKRV
jgi:hypothetical protein